MKLPNVYANKIDKDIKNNTEFVYNERTTHKDIGDLKKEFDHNGYVNRLNVLITTKNGSKNEKLVLCKDNYFININNEKIYFDDIIDYQIKK